MTDSRASVQALVRLLEVFSLPNEAAVRTKTIDAVVESFDAAVAGIVAGGIVIESVGLGSDAHRLVEVAALGPGKTTAEIGPLGTAHVLVLPIDGSPDATFILVRSTVPFTEDDAVLARAMVRLMRLGARTVAVLEEQRLITAELERHIVANEALTARLEQRHRSLVERVLRIQKKVISGAPGDEPMQLIVEQASELFGTDVVAIRHVDRPEGAAVWAINLGVEVEARLKAEPAAVGISMRALAEGGLVVDRSYEPVFLRDGNGPRAAMSTPVYRLGRAVGTMTVIGGPDRLEPHDEEDREALLILSGYASVALSAGATNAALHESLARAEWRAIHDDLTELPNRRQVLDQIDKHLRAESSPTVLFIDVDGFKTANDLYGHKAGDLALIAMARRLTESLREGELVGRLAGDEFVAVLPPMGQKQAKLVAQRISATLGEPFDLDGQQLRLPVSIGVTTSPADTADGYLEAADYAMNRAKGLSGERISFYDDTLRTERLRRIEIEQELRKATTDMSEFSVFYQPIVAEPRKEIGAYEALVRWTNPVLGSVRPDEFIPVAEQLGLITRIDLWVLRTVIEQSTRAPADAATFSINMSPASFLAPGLPGTLRSAFAGAAVVPERLAIEITERVMLGDPTHVARNIAAVQGVGVSVVVDDFGTGYSSLSYLRSLNIDGLKIDRSFVVGAEHNARGRAVLAAVIGLAHDLGLEPIAEGIETTEQLSLVHELGCNRYQGYLFGRPLPFPAPEAQVMVH